MVAIRPWALAIALALSPVAFGTALAQTAAAPGTLIGKAAIKALIGNTMVFTGSGQSLYEMAVYVLADGTCRVADQVESKRIEWKIPLEWSIQGEGQFCMFEKGKRPAAGDCSMISITGDDVSLTAGNRPTQSLKLLKGNARDL